MIALTVYYVVANVFCFFAYREFKGMMFDHGMDGGGIMTQGFRQQRRNDDDGSRAGSASGAANYEVRNAPPAQSSSGGGGGGGFKSFQGKGRSIGGS